MNVNQYRGRCRPESLFKLWLVQVLWLVIAGCGADSGEGDKDNVATAPGKNVVYVSGDSGTITTFAFDHATGGLYEKQVIAAGKSASFLAINRARTNLYALAGWEPSRVASFRIARGTGLLTANNDFRDSGALGAAHLSVGPGDDTLFVAHYGSGDLITFDLIENGSIGDIVDRRFVGDEAHMGLVGPTDRFLYVPCLGTDRIRIYEMASAPGPVAPFSPNEIEAARVPIGSGPRHIAFHPLGERAYVINELGNTVISFDADASTGSLSAPESISSLPDDYDGIENTTAHILVHPSGRFVYGSNRGHDSIVIYAVDPSSGRLSLMGFETGNGTIDEPRNFDIDPSGKWLIVGNQDDDSIGVFRIGEDGFLTMHGEPIAVSSKPTFIGIVAL